MINIDHDQTEDYVQSIGQAQFLDLVKQLLRDVDAETHYVMASPLNLIAELFTEKGSGTLIRRGAELKSYKTYKALDPDLLEHSLEGAFGRSLDPKFLKTPIQRIWVERDYRGGAIMKMLGDLPYLTKFWVVRNARGEGLARDIWNAMTAEYEQIVWRSRNGNGFNGWYSENCDGLQRVDDWTVFWRGLAPEGIASAIDAALMQGEDFVETEDMGAAK